MTDIKVVSQQGSRAVTSYTVSVKGTSLDIEDELVRENGNWRYLRNLKPGSLG
jgi:hypothetical protein